ncbi:MAG: metallophosphoesterase family protein [Nanopusillaceae archaeon]
MKILVLADIHYPKCNIEEIYNIIKYENPEEIILLGDVAENLEYFYEFIKKLKKFTNKKIIVVCGDNEKKYRIECKNYYIKNKILFIHGDSSNIINENFTKLVAKIIKKISKKLLLKLYFFRFFKYRKLKVNIVLGHSHLIGKSILIKAYSAGTLTTKHYFLDRGFIVIDNKKIEIKRLDSSGAAGI